MIERIWQKYEIYRIAKSKFKNNKIESVIVNIYIVSNKINENDLATENETNKVLHYMMLWQRSATRDQ